MHFGQKYFIDKYKTQKRILHEILSNYQFIRS